MSVRSWKTIKIGELGRVVTGKTPTTQDLNNFGNTYPFITPRDMTGQKKISNTERFLSEKGMLSVKNCLLPPDAICVSCIGSDMGKVVMTTQNSVTNQQLNSIICNTSFDPNFVYYAIIKISDELRNTAHHSTAVPILNKTAFSNFKIGAPDLPTQTRIAAILSALDDKIELNRRTNATLEAIAQAIFKEWFVDFRFPGATGEMKDSELGPIPRGWRIGKLGEIYQTTSGGTPNRTHPEYYQDGNTNWIKSKELTGSFVTETEEKITEQAVKKSSAKILPAYSVLIAMYGANVGNYGITSMESTCNQAICAFIPSEQYPYSFIYHF
nr:hypothetical protein [Desulfobacula sp.]